MSTTALDIGSYSLKALVGHPGSSPKISAIVESLNPSGIAVPNDDASQTKLTKVVEAFFNDYKLPSDKLRLSLPESIVSTKVISIPPLSDAELASAIDWQAEQNIPIPPEDLSLQYEVIYRPKDRFKKMMQVLLVATRKSIVERYMVMFEDLGMEPTLIETQMLSLIRSLQFTATDEDTMVVDWGGSGMGIAMMSGVRLQFVTHHLGGGTLLTRSLEKSLGLDHKQAEAYKRTFGLDEKQLEGRIKKVLLPVVMEVIDQLKRSMQFYSTNNPQKSVKRIVLAGGSANLVGLVPLITATLGVEVLLVSPLSTVKADKEKVDLSRINQTVMGVVVGMMMRND